MYAERMATEARAAGDAARARYWERVARRVDEAPPLTPEQRDRLRVLLRPTNDPGIPGATDLHPIVVRRLAA